MAQPLVSIIIPAYNAGRWVAQTIESALAQTWQTKEIIVVNDGSTDNTAEIIEGYRDRGIRIISQPNRGLSGARNTGQRASGGSFLQFLDADDLLSPDKIAGQMAALAHAPPGTLATSRWGHFRRDHTRAQFNVQILWRDFEKLEYLGLAARSGCSIQVAAWLVPGDVANAAGPFDEELRNMEDIEYFTRAVLASSGIRYSPDGCVYYRSFHTSSMSRNRGRQAAQSMLRSLMLVEGHLLRHQQSLQMRRAAADQYQHLVYRLYPDHLDLVRQAEQRIRDLGGADISLPMGRAARVLSTVVGWRAVQRLRAWLWRKGIYLNRGHFVSD